jgi:dihydroxyacetone kinase-like protein
MTLLSTVGGASGALWGASLLKMAQWLPDRDRADDAEMVRAIEAFVDAVKQRGGAQRGDKTMVDVWEPAVAYLTERLAAGVPFAQAVQEVAKQAAGWADATQPLVAKKGRAAYLGPRSQGHIDPGSYSTALWWQALAEAVTP